MKRITMNIGTHGVQTTAAEMRRRLAQALSKIPGDQIVFFNLTLHLENYQPPAVQALNRVQMEARDILNNNTVFLHTDDLVASAKQVAQVLKFESAIRGELANPEND